MSRLAAAHLFDLAFGKFDHLKDGFQSCLACSNPQEFVDLKSIKNRIHNMIFIRYTQDSGSVTSWSLRDINFQVSQERRSPGSHQEAYSTLPNFQL